MTFSGIFKKTDVGVLQSKDSNCPGMTTRFSSGFFSPPVYVSFPPLWLLSCAKARIGSNCFCKRKNNVVLSIHQKPQPNIPFQIVQKIETFRYWVQVILRSDGRSFRVFRDTFLYSSMYDIIWKQTKKVADGIYMYSQMSQRGNLNSSKTKLQMKPKAKPFDNDKGVFFL